MFAWGTLWLTLKRLVPCHCLDKCTTDKSLLEERKIIKKRFMLFENKLLRDGGNIQPNECTLFSATLFIGGTFPRNNCLFYQAKNFRSDLG